jgi:hypothetical protein
MYDSIAYPVGLRAAWGSLMKNYSIVRVGNEYVVQAGDKSVLKIASRRRAARLVTDAAGLLDLSHQSPVSLARFPAKFLDDAGRRAYVPRRDTSPQREACYLEG